MACDGPTWGENCLELRCPCRGCLGALEYTGPSVRGTLVFLECNVCRCAHVAPMKREVPQIHGTLSDEEKSRMLHRLNGVDPDEIGDC